MFPLGQMTFSSKVTDTQSRPCCYASFFSALASFFRLNARATVRTSLALCRSKKSISDTYESPQLHVLTPQAPTSLTGF